MSSPATLRHKEAKKRKILADSPSRTVPNTGFNSRLIRKQHQKQIDFYREVACYEIEMIKSALDLCGGNQARAAKLLTMKPTTLNAKMKHYGLNPVRSISAHTE